MARKQPILIALTTTTLAVGCLTLPIGRAQSFEVLASPKKPSPSTTLPDSVGARCDKVASQVIKEFVASFNTGGVNLDRYFAFGDEFKWFSDSQRIRIGRRLGIYNPEDRSSLMAYLQLAKRIRGDMSILSLKFTGARKYDPNPPSAPHGFKIKPVPPDAIRHAVGVGYAMTLDWGGFRWGKASVDCDRRQIDVWSIGAVRNALKF